MMGSGQMVVQLGRGPITYPAGQPSESQKYVETGTSLYVVLRRLTKLVSSPASQDYVEQIPDSMSWLMIHNSTMDTELTINVRNLVAKIRKSKIIELL